MTRRLRVCLDARIIDGRDGGVQQVLIGLAHGLSALEGDLEEYLFLTWDDRDAWLRPHLGGACRVLAGGSPPAESRWRRRLRRVKPLQAAWQHAARLLDSPGSLLPRSAGIIEAAGVDVMHFTLQSAFLTDVPSIYHPHDLQHVHLPQYFSTRERAAREVRYRAFCAQAETVAVTSSWVKRDLTAHYGIDPARIAVIHWAPPTEAYPEPTAGDLQRVRRELDLPDTFILYPAQTWPHKNHITLLRAIAALRARDGVDVPLVSTGSHTEHFAVIRAEAERLGVSDLVRFPGYVPALTLQALYRMARAAVIPTRFEAASYPVWEAFQAGVPVACSTVTSLPEQVGDAALTFDPGSVDEVAAAVRRLWTDAELRGSLVQKGRANVQRFSWDRTARTFRAHYRRMAGQRLSSADRALLDAPPLL